MSKKPKIEILVVAHKPAVVPDNPLLKSIQVGAALSDNKLKVDYFDNDGDNMSTLNRSYCELTAIYWAWKNLDSDYYGLFHYRRYFSFSDAQENDLRSGIAYPTVENALPSLNLEESAMRDVIESHDLIIPRKEDTANATHDSSIYEQYRNEHYIKDLDFCLDYVTKNYPEIAKFNNVLDRKDGYFCNMFVMNKVLFNQYCTFMFDVLAAFDKEMDISQYDLQQHRVDGFIAERLTNIFIQYLQSLEKYKIKELQIAYFQNTDPKPVLAPVAKEKNVPVVLAANNYYIPYISSLIHSIAENSTKEHTYDINIFHRDISAENAAILTKEFADRANFSIRFYDISSRYEEYKNLFTRGHFAIETYFRLFIQDIMVDYDKVLYLDGDMIVKHDIAELYETDVTDHLLAAALDPDTAGLYNGFEPQKKNYMDTILKIKNPYEYFQAGVILFNLNEMRKTLKVDDLLEFASSYDWELLDQDVLNYIAQGKTKFVDMSWNVMYDWRRIRLTQIVSLAPIPLYLDYVKARKNPKIIHYAGPEKPWHDPEGDYAAHYWQAARKSAFYEIIIARMGDWRVKHVGRPEQLSLKRKAINAARRTADQIAPLGTVRRKPITKLSKGVKRVIRKLK